MSESMDQILHLIESLSVDEMRTVRDHLRRRVPLHPLEEAWGATAEAILTAIARSTDLTQRGIRGILAEAMFEQSVLPPMVSAGWNTEAITGDQAFDFLLQKNGSRVRIQVKLQRRERGTPKDYAARSRAALNCPEGRIYVVEVQKTRSGEKNGEKTRPYRFGDFDLLAVSMHPSSGDWNRFFFTVGGWLLPRKSDATLIEIFQPVPEHPDGFWTDDASLAVQWFQSGVQRRMYS